MRFLFFLLLSGCATAPPLSSDTGNSPAWESHCPEEINVAEYCSSFDSETLRSDPSVQRAKGQCLGFFRQAARSADLLCSYFGELDELMRWGDGKDSATVSAKGKRLHREYSSLTEKSARELDTAYATLGAADKLGAEGQKYLQDELSCRQAPGRAPGLALLGLAAQMRVDQKTTFERLHAALTVLARATRLESTRPLREIQLAMGIDTATQSYQRALDGMVSHHLDEFSLLTLGRKKVPSSPEFESYYAWLTNPEARMGVGRSLASVRCWR